MAKYDSLKEFLERSPRGTVSMTFGEVGELVGGLPDSAHRYQAWWANERDGRHVQARAWINAGYLVSDVDLQNRSVTFRRD
jgi:hypothetical protein